MAFNRLAEVYRQEKKIGGSLTSAAGKTLKESLDPRQMIDPKGIVATLFPGLKPYKAISEKKSRDSIQPTVKSSSPDISSLSSPDISELTSAMKVTAKNTLSIPLMARDINLIKTNIFKMTKALGATPETKKTDIFWKGAKERESMLESAMKSVRKTSGFMGLSPTSLKKQRDGQTEKTALFVKAELSLQDMATQAALGSAAGGAGGGVIGKLKTLLPFVFKAALPVLGIAGIAGLLYFLIKKDSGEGRTIDDMQSGGGYTPDMGGTAGPVPDVASDAELKQARENMRKSDDATIRAAAAELDRQDSLKATPNQSEAESRRLGMSSSSITPTPATENVPSNVVRSGSGEPIRTGSGGYLTSGEDTSPSKVSSGISDSLVSSVKTLEGFSAKAFWDHKQYSIGYGTKASGPDEVISEKEADRRLRAELEKSQKTVVDFAKKHNYSWNQGQIDSLTSFIYNLGPGALKQVTANGTRSNEEISKKMLEYNKASGNVSQGLVKRRNIEFAMFSGGQQSSVTPQTPAPSSGSNVSTASSSVSDGQRQAMIPSGGGNTVIDNSTKTTVASADKGGKTSSAYNDDLIRTLIASAA
jgi:GH24 family phage-related lysozyme (muramidase)